MARKVFISFLGTSDYLETHYTFESRYISKSVRFIQEAAIGYNCSDWTEEDAIYIFMTSTAKSCNWEDNGHVNRGPRRGLKSCLEAMELKPKVHGIEIPEGYNEKEIWSIFEIVYGSIEEDDEIYFDVTHAFRSIPLFSSVLFNYSRFMKGVNVASVVYGAFETLGSPKYVSENIPVEQRYAPVINLTSLIHLQQYTDIASGLENFGRVNMSEVTWFVKHSKGEPYQKYLTTISQALKDFDNALTSNNMVTLKEAIFYNKFKKSYNAMKGMSTEVPNALMEILDRLDISLSGFTNEGESWENVDASIEWASRFRMLPLAYTLARESIAWRIAEILIRFDPYDQKAYEGAYKEFISAVCSVDEQSVRDNAFYGVLKEYKNTTLALLQEDIIKSIRQSGYFKTISSNRNTINHGKGKATYNDLCRDFEEAYYGCLDIIKNS